MLKEYFSTLNTFPFMSVNAYNFWTVLGLNGVRYRSDAWVINRPLWGKMAVLIIYALVMYFGYRGKKTDERYMVMGGSTIVSIFTFAVGMHERYMFAGMLLCLSAFIISEDLHFLWFYIAVSCLDGVNVADVLYMRSGVAFANDILARTVGFAMVVLAFCYWIVLIKKYCLITQQKEQ